MLSPMNIFLTIWPVIVVALMGVALGACGVKSSPQHPANSSYPQHYPATKKSAPVYTGGERPAEPTLRPPGPASGIYQYPNPFNYVPPEK